MYDCMTFRIECRRSGLFFKWDQVVCKASGVVYLYRPSRHRTRASRAEMFNRCGIYNEEQQTTIKIQRKSRQVCGTMMDTSVGRMRCESEEHSMGLITV